MTFTLEPSPFGHRVVGKLGRQRKLQKFSVSPCDDNTIMVQGDGCIGQFDFRTRQGVFNTKGEYFVHLSKALGAVDFDFPEEFVSACLQACPALGSESEYNGVTVVNTVHIIK